jgi:hypothetical protein
VIVGWRMPSSDGEMGRCWAVVRFADRRDGAVVGGGLAAVPTVVAAVSSRDWQGGEDNLVFGDAAELAHALKPPPGEPAHGQGKSAAGGGEAAAAAAAADVSNRLVKGKEGGNQAEGKVQCAPTRLTSLQAAMVHVGCSWPLSGQGDSTGDARGRAGKEALRLALCVTDAAGDMSVSLLDCFNAWSGGSEGPRDGVGLTANGGSPVGGGAEGGFGSGALPAGPTFASRSARHGLRSAGLIKVVSHHLIPAALPHVSPSQVGVDAESGRRARSIAWLLDSYHTMFQPGCGPHQHRKPHKPQSSSASQLPHPQPPPALVILDSWGYLTLMTQRKLRKSTAVGALPESGAVLAATGSDPGTDLNKKFQGSGREYEPGDVRCHMALAPITTVHTEGMGHLKQVNGRVACCLPPLQSRQQRKCL